MPALTTDPRPRASPLRRPGLYEVPLSPENASPVRPVEGFPMPARAIRTFLLHLMDEEQASPSTVANHVAALRFLYGVTLGRPEVAVQIPYPKVPHTLPDILSSEEVMALLDALGSVKYRAVVTTMYAAGLRISEACSLKPGDIDSQRMLIHVRLGKRGRDRFVMLSQKLLELLRVYWTLARPPGIYLFMGATKRGHVGPEAVRHALREAARRVGLHKRVTPHVLLVPQTIPDSKVTHPHRRK